MDVLGWDGNTLQAQATTLQRALIFRGTQPCGDPVTPKRAHGCRLDVPTAEKPRRSLGGTEGARPSVATPRHASPGVAKAAASPAACPRSQWATSAARWQKCTPMGPKMGSWLAARTSTSNGKLWGVGCKACRWASMSRPIVLTDPSVQPYVKFSVSPLRLANFRRHAHSISHREACALYLRHLANSDSKPNTAEPHTFVLHAAPCREDFKAAWVALRTGSNNLRRSPKKARSIQWCLYEALRDWELRFLQAAGCINIALDERNGRLLVKYSASDAKLDVRWGCLALLRNRGSTSQDVAAAVLDGVQRLCTRRVAHPGIYPVQAKRRCCEKTRDSILKRIEMFTADGAASEQLAGKMLHPGSLRSGLAPKLPNLRLVLRDKAHASRRITERTFQADPILHEILQVLLYGQPSVARLLHHSLPFQTIFEREVGKQTRPGNAADIRGTVKNMSFAKQRFDSSAKPLGRCVLNLDALISTMEIIMRQRPTSSKEAQGARQFLAILNERSVLLMGMLADATDECLVLTRFFDKEAFQLEDTARQLNGFRNKLHWLFSKRGCLGTGFTSLAREHLDRAKLVPCPKNGLPRTLGGHGASPATIAQCLGHMVAWARLVDEVCKTEFPDFELLNAFAAFKIVSQPPPTARRHVERLTKAFQLPTPAPVAFSQLADHLRVASRLGKEAPEESAAASWQRALQRTQDNRKRRRSFPADGLIPLLQRFVVAPGSTAGIEQNFSKMKSSEQAEERRCVLELAIQQHPEPPGELLSDARLVWAASFGSPRTSGERHSRRLSGNNVHVASAAAWLRQRRAGVAAASASSSRPGCVVDAGAIEAAAREAWGQWHDNEALYQSGVRGERQAAGVQEGVLDQDALGEDAGSKTQEYRNKEQDRQAKLEQRVRRLQTVGRAPAKPDFAGRRVFVDPEAEAALAGNHAGAWARARAAAGLLLSDDRARATVFVVLAPSDAGTRSRLVAALTGGYLVTPELFLSPSGTALRLRRALNTPRRIFVSSACFLKHSGLFSLAERVAAAQPPARWTWYHESKVDDQRVVFMDIAAQRAGAKHASELATLLLPGQLGAATYAGFPRRTTMATFLNSTSCVDSKFTRAGICGR